MNGEEAYFLSRAYTDKNSVDPTNYYDKTTTDTLLSAKADASTTYTKTETDTLLADKVNVTIWNKTLQDGAAAHNALYVEEDITDMFDSGDFSTNVANGTFKDIYPGMYITKTYTATGLETSITEDFVIGDLDYHLGHGNTETTNHHALVLMKNGTTVLHKMSATDDTTGAYANSDMWNNIIPLYATAMQDAFGSAHILSHKELLTTAIDSSGVSMAGTGLTGYASNYGWRTVLFNIMNNAMRFGYAQTSSSYYDTGDCAKQISLFRLVNELNIAHQGKNGTKYSDWLRDVASSTNYAVCTSRGYCLPNNASDTNLLRGYFLLT